MTRTQFLRLLLLAPLGGQRLAAAPGGFDRSLAFLLGRQSADGAWRSDAYGAFRDGRALTPIVLRCLSRVPDRSLDEARARAARWLVSRGDELLGTFPIHLAAALLETMPRVEALSPLRSKAVGRLLELQAPGGGWSYSPLPPPARGPLPAMQQPNVSATAIALDGLHAAGCREFDDPRPFLGTCHNHDRGDPSFDDGGFFQLPDDPARNKAGRAGTDRHGGTRYRSYAAATADGLRALLACGEDPGAARPAAARRWLGGFAWSPGATPSDLSYYTARSIALAAAFPGGGPGNIDALAPAVAAARGPDGSWRNPAGEMREDCPLVATALALEAMTLAAL